MEKSKKDKDSKHKDKKLKDKSKEKEKSKSKTQDETKEKLPSEAKPTAKTINLVVFDGDPTHNWVTLFSKYALEEGLRLRVVQASWMDCELTYFGDKGNLLLAVAPVRDSDTATVKPQSLTVEPHFVLMRNQPRGPIPANDRRKVLFGLMMANIPSINSLFSEYCNLERPLMYGALTDIVRRVGRDKFPLVDINYYSSASQMVIGPEFPAIIKVSHAHAGMGKIKVDTNEGFRDMATVLALNNDYCTAEPFIPGEFGIRVQKIGRSYRVYKKVATGSGWKSQFGGADLQVIPLTDEYKLWVDECAKCFGGMDILAVDAIHGKDGKTYIIELNGTAIGIKTQHWEEDTAALCELAVERINAIYAAKS